MIDELAHELKISAGAEGGTFAYFVGFWTNTHAEQKVVRLGTCLVLDN